MPAKKLLEIAYVHRRGRKETWAYQRMISKDRLENLGEYLSKRGAIIPNSILVSFDEDVAQGIEASYASNPKQLTVPLTFCSAWIIDGQHRLFGFSRKKNWELSKEKFELLVVGFTKLNSPADQAALFVTINDKQRRIKRGLLCDISTLIGDLQDPITWPSLLAQELNKKGPWENKIKFSEIETKKPISVEGFIRYALSEFLLGRKYRSKDYHGPLFRYAPFEITKQFQHKSNRAAFSKQIKLLNKYFSVVRQLFSEKDSAKDQWENYKTFYLTRVAGVNALFLVLNRILERSLDKGEDVERIDLKKILAPVPSIKFTKPLINRYGGGYGGYRQLANTILRKINAETDICYKLYSHRRRE